MKKQEYHKRPGRTPITIYIYTEILDKIDEAVGCLKKEDSRFSRTKFIEKSCEDVAERIIAKQQDFLAG